MGGGYIAYREIRDGPQRVELYSLADGSRRVFVAPAGATINSDPLYVSATEMLVLGSYDSMQTVFRVQLHSLPIDGG